MYLNLEDYNSNNERNSEPVLMPPKSEVSHGSSASCQSALMSYSTNIYAAVAVNEGPKSKKIKGPSVCEQKLAAEVLVIYHILSSRTHNSLQTPEIYNTSGQSVQRNVNHHVQVPAAQVSATLPVGPTSHSSGDVQKQWLPRTELVLQTKGKTQYTTQDVVYSHHQCSSSQF